MSIPTQLLLIEDDLQIRNNLTELLTLQGYKVEAASSGLDGLECAQSHRPDLILCDVMMPQIDGYQVLEAIRTDRSLSAIPFIFLTAKANSTDIRFGMNLGADDYLTKPFTSDDLISAIESRLKHRQYWMPPITAPVSYLTSLRGSNCRGSMMLHTDDCLYFFIKERACYVLHPKGTFRVDGSLEELAAHLNPVLFFRVNRKEIVQRSVVQRYTYWEKGKYCLFLTINGQDREVILPRARYRPFLDWLKS
jgi:two-component system, OmpR family, response regulator